MHTILPIATAKIDHLLSQKGTIVIAIDGNCTAGKEIIGKLLALRDTGAGPEVLIGAGVKASVIEAFRKEFPSSRAFHMSGKTEVESGMIFRREGVPMGIPGFDEWHLQQTGEEAVRLARTVLDNL